MSEENQHWVPKFLVKNFVDKDGRVFSLDIHTGKVTKPPPKYVASAPDFNVFVVNDKPISFEDRLEKIETKAAPILHRIVKQQNLVGLSNDDRLKVAEFMAAQSFRTAAFYQGFEGGPDRDEFGAVFAQLWESAFLTAGEILRRHWALMVIDTDEVFYLGDNPVVLQRTEDPKDGSGLGFDVEGIEAFMPLSPKCALYVPCRTISDQIIEGYNNALSVHRSLRVTPDAEGRVASSLLQLSQKVIRDAHSLYQAMTIGTAVTAILANIENLNYLQCSWSYAAIYSSRRDFTFAERVFRENPQYRAVPVTKLEEIGRRFTKP